MKTINLPCFGIAVKIGGEYDHTGKSSGGSITSNLHEPPTDEDEEEFNAAERYNAAMDALESIILAHAVAGVDIESPAYLEGIKTAVEACANNI